mmetsp:Transcript_111036/g.319073  ORF Transcript_111036/g.319073 Transcript_111036/m.319073 type:complete len:201 (+) Transcript_111036:144-746(+)
MLLILDHVLQVEVRWEVGEWSALTCEPRHLGQVRRGKGHEPTWPPIVTAPIIVIEVRLHFIHFPIRERIPLPAIGCVAHESEGLPAVAGENAPTSLSEANPNRRRRLRATCPFTIGQRATGDVELRGEQCAAPQVPCARSGVDLGLRAHPQLHDTPRALYIRPLLEHHTIIPQLFGVAQLAGQGKAVHVGMLWQGGEPAG